jgi:hypothetical protein
MKQRAISHLHIYISNYHSSWFTTMIGKRDTLVKIKQELAANNVRYRDD